MIIDTFLFNKDFNTLQIRLEELYEIVDLFVICESKFTFSGEQKPLYLSQNLDTITKYRDKVRIVVESKRHLTRIPFIREIHQRKVISKFISSFGLRSNDLIIYSDCDEIPRRESIVSLFGNVECNAILEMRNFTNYLNMELGTWSRARVVSGKNYKSIESMREDIHLFTIQKNRQGLKRFITRVPYYWTTRNFYLWKLPKVFKPRQLDIISNAGWHFNNLFSVSDILVKVESSAHQELNNSNLKSNLFDRYLSGKDIYFGHQYNKVAIDNTFPKSVYNEIEKWKNYIYL